MKRILLILPVLLFLVDAVSAAQQPGQPPRGPYSRPTISPYINLLRRGSLTENYYGLTRPQIQFQNEAQRLQQEITQTRQEATQENVRRDLPTTGHSTSFLNTGGYFLNRGGQGPQRGVSNSRQPQPRGGRGR